MYGQHGQDLLFGDDGDDRVRGGPDQDELHGGADDDYMMGDQEDDVMYGDSGSDTMLGYLGNDTIDGGDGSDFLYDQSGDDTIVGGDGDDVATGEDGDDRISGDAGNDLIYGFADDDWLRGGSGNDWMLGGDGDDAMFGGSGVDTMFGQADDDRFLTRSGDSVRDQSVDDAIVMFEDQTSNWTDAEIEVLDLGFEQLHDRTQNTALLRDPLTTNPLTFYKYSSLGGAAGINYLSWSTSCNFSGCTTTYHREIRIADWDETNSFYNYAYQYVGIHELAHNWDSDLEFTSAASTLAGLWNQFLAISDWQQSNPGSGYSQSLDGNWWYLSSASFAENYGRTNPNEDMATSWEYYFTDYQDPNLNHSNLQSKMDILDQVFNALM